MGGTKLLFGRAFFKGLLVLVCFFSLSVMASYLAPAAQAAAKTWDGGGTDGTCGGNAGDGNKFSCGANWNGDTVPVAGDTLTFNSTSTKDATIDASFQGTAASFTIASGYTGTVTMARSFTTTGAFSQATGTFNAASQNLSVGSNFALSGGTFTASSGNFSLGGNFTITNSPVFSANGGTLTLNGTGTQNFTCGTVTFNHVVISATSNAIISVGTTCVLPLGNNPVVTTHTSPGGGSLTVFGSLTGSGTLTYTNGSVLELNGTSALQGFSGLIVPSLTIGGFTADFSALTTFSLSGNVRVNSGSLAFPVPSGAITIGSLTLAAGSFTASSANMTVSANITISEGAVFNHNNGTITLNSVGSQGLTCASDTVFNSVVISGTSSAVITVGSLCNLPLGHNPILTTSANIAGGGGILVNGTLSGTGTLTYERGTNLQLGAGGTLSGFTGLSAISIINQGATSNFSTYSPFTVTTGITISSGTLSLPPTVSTGSLTISGGTFNAPSGVFTASQNVTISNSPTFNHNNGTLNLTGNGTSISCANVTFNLVTFNNTGSITVNNSCNLSLGNNPTLANSVSLAGTLTGTGTLSQSAGTFSFSSGAALVNFSSLSVNNLAVTGGTANFASLSSVSVAGTTTMSSGSLSLPNGATLTGLVTVSAGTFNAPSGTLNLGGALTVTGSPTFNHNNGTVNFTGSGTLSCGTFSFNRVTLTNSGTLTVSSNCTLPLGADPTIANAVTLSGTITGSGTVTMTTGTLQLNSGHTFSGFSALTGTSNGLNVSGSTVNWGSYTSVTLGGNFTLTTPGIFTAPSGTMSVGGNFAHTSGTFNHNNGTMVLNGGSNQTISGIATTFNNLSKELTSAAAQTLTFPSGTNNTQTVLGTLTLKGYDATARLLLRSSSQGTQWRIDPQGTRDILYLDVRDGNNLNASPIQMGGTDSLDSTNNTGFNFGSLDPNAPSNLGPANVISAIIVPSLQPLFSFTLSDPNALDTVRYQIQISTVADFLSTVVDYTSGLLSQGTKSFTVGQSAGTGTYSVGSGSQSLTTGEYFWRVMTTDNNGLTSAFTYGNGGSMAFAIDSDPPDAFTPQLNVTSPTTNTQPTVTFSTTDNVAVSYYRVKVDNSAFSTQTSPYQVNTLSNGAHTITVRAIDTTGNFTDGSVNITVDTSLPAAFTPELDVTSPTTNQTPILTFSTTDDDGIDHYEVQIDAGSFTTQTSPYQLPTLAGGAHTITVRAFDIAGNTRDGSVNVTVDITQPASFTPTLNVTSPTTNPTPSVLFSTTDNVAIDHYEVQVDAGSFTTQTSPYQLPTLSEGDHTITVRAFDTAGNTRDGSVNVTVIPEPPDTAPEPFTPELNVTSPTNNQTPILTFSTTAELGIDHYEVQIDAGAFTTQTSPYQLPTLNEGEHTITVRVFDTENNTTDGSLDVTIDITPPNTFTPLVDRTSPTNDTTPTFTFSTTDTVGIDHYEVKIDDGSFTTRTSPYSPTLSDGEHTITVRAFDEAGNTREGSVSITINTTSPAAFTPQLNVTSPTTNTTPTVTFETTDDVGINYYQVRVDAGAYSTQSSPYQLPTLSHGTHTILVRAFDMAGNFQIGSVDVTVDNLGPADFTPELNVDSPTTNTAPIVSFATTDSDGVDHYEVKIDSGSFSTQTSPYQLPTLSEGEHTITVRAFDLVGNFTDGSVEVVIDTTGPSIGFNAPKKVSNADITNTTVTVIDTGGVLVADVVVTGGVKNCTQTLSSQVSCTITISSSGTVSISATDSVGNDTNTSIPGYIIETVAPQIAISAPTKNSLATITDTTLFVTDNYGIDVSGVRAISGGSIVCNQTNPGRVDCTATVSETGDLVINANDLASNAAAETEAGYVVTSTAPAAFTPTLSTDPAEITSDDTPILFFSTTDTDGIDRYEVKIDNDAFSVQISPYQLPTLADGFHTITVRAYDTVGNFTDGSTSVTIDTAGPAAFTPTLDVTSPTRITQPTVTFFTTDTIGIDHYEVKVDGGAFSTQTSPYLLPTLSEGSHVITVRAFDTTDRTTDETVAVVVDLTPPASFTPQLNVTSPTTNPAPILSFSTTDNVAVARYEVQLDGGTFSTQTSPYTLPNLSNGEHMISVMAYDTAGNSQSGSISVTVQDEEITVGSGNSSNSAGSSSVIYTPECSNLPPGGQAPWLYAAVAEDGNTIRLYFTPSAGPTDNYVLEYGTQPGNYIYGAQLDGNPETRTYVVGSLYPQTTYYFRIRGGNGCATGNWSNELSATTRSLVSFRQLQFTTSELTPVPYSPPDLNPSVMQDEIDLEPDPESVEESESSEIQGYKLKLKVLDSNGQPVVGAKVTVHSKVQEGITDENGVVAFDKVEPGQHQVIVNHGQFEGEQTVNLTGDVEEFDLKITIEQKDVLFSPVALVIIAGLGIVIILLLVLIYRMKKRIR